MRSGDKHTSCSAQDTLVYAYCSEVPAIKLPFTLKLCSETINPVVMPLVSISHGKTCIIYPRILSFGVLRRAKMGHVAISLC